MLSSVTGPSPALCRLRTGGVAFGGLIARTRGLSDAPDALGGAVYAGVGKPEAEVGTTYE